MGGHFYRLLKMFNNNEIVDIFKKQAIAGPALIFTLLAVIT